MRTKQDPLRRVRGSAVTKSSSPNRKAISTSSGTDIVDLTAADTPVINNTISEQSPSEQQASDSEDASNGDANLNNHVKGEASGSSEIEDDDKDNVASRLENKRVVAEKSRIHGFVEEKIYTVRIDYKFQRHWEGDDYSTTEGAYTYRPDATAAAIEWFENGNLTYDVITNILSTCPFAVSLQVSYSNIQSFDMSSKADPLRRVRDGGIAKSRSSNQGSGKVIDLTKDETAPDTVQGNHGGDAKELEDDNSEDAGDTDDDEEEEDAEEDDEDIVVHKEELAEKRKTHDYTRDQVYTLRVDHKAQVADREDYSSVEGVYAFIPDANDAALSYIQNTYGYDSYGPEAERTWGDDGSVHIQFGTEVDEEIVEISIEKTTLTRRIPHGEKPQPLS
ncbi:MAG: hypothetical protein Q9218_006239 [Villophora microphyllina]